MRKIDVFTHIYPAGFFEKLMKLAPDFKDAPHSAINDSPVSLRLLFRIAAF